jgi:hypothetical protein
MHIATITRRDGTQSRTLASGWTRAECDYFAAAQAAEGNSVTFHYGVWR